MPGFGGGRYSDGPYGNEVSSPYGAGQYGSGGYGGVTPQSIYFDGILDIGAGGSVTLGDLAYARTRTADQLLNGYPDWWAGNVIDSPFDGVMSFNGGSIKCYALNPVQTAGSGLMDDFSHGFISQVAVGWRGTFDDFAIYAYDGTDTTGRDPATDMVPVTSNNGSINGSGVIGTAWTQHYRVLYPPKDARYVVPMIGLGTTANNKGHYLDALQFSIMSAASNTLPSYVKPRALNVKVQPTRKNLSVNPSFSVSNANLSNTANVTPTRITTDHAVGDSCLSVAVANTGTTVSLKESQLIEVEHGDDFSVKFRVKHTSTLSGTYTPMVIFYTQGGAEVSRVTGDVIHTQTNDWEDRGVSTLVPEGAYQAEFYHLYAANHPASGDTILIDAVDIEKAASIGDYFDGSFPGGEYLWEQGGTAGLTRSYFYEDRTKRHYIIDRVFRENVALGTSVASIEYAQGTEVGYGFGPYGSGPYGG